MESKIISFKLEEIFQSYQTCKAIPPLQGVYFFLSASGDVLYIGHSKNIGSRLNNHRIQGGWTGRGAVTVVIIEGASAHIEEHLLEELKTPYNKPELKMKNWTYRKVKNSL
ncbi:GIY-YIG nuclease family protein [Paenibacillus polymyxa]|uniref:GIY-YIG nuclease family protein n=1 Tax=Paenibacillus polymyxa TaxID=1406 RepID=UPI0032B01273